MADCMNCKKALTDRDHLIFRAEVRRHGYTLQESLNLSADLCACCSQYKDQFSNSVLAEVHDYE